MTNKTTKLKALQVCKHNAEKEIESLKDTITRTQATLTLTRSNLADIEKSIKELNSSGKELVISEHAILRYFERVLGFDLDNIKQEILNEGNVKSAGKIGSGKYPIFGDHKAVIENGTIITII